MQFAMSDVSPVPAAVASALHITIGELKATPDTPVALFVFAEIVPDTCEPWPLSSAQMPWCRSSPALYDVAQPTALPARSGCVLSMPVSTIPTFTPPLFGKAARPARVPALGGVDVGVRRAARLTRVVEPVLLGVERVVRRGERAQHEVRLRVGHRAAGVQDSRARPDPSRRRRRASRCRRWC